MANINSYDLDELTKVDNDEKIRYIENNLDWLPDTFQNKWTQLNALAQTAGRSEVLFKHMGQNNFIQLHEYNINSLINIHYRNNNFVSGGGYSYSYTQFVEELLKRKSVELSMTYSEGNLTTSSELNDADYILISAPRSRAKDYMFPNIMDILKSTVTDDTRWNLGISTNYRQINGDIFSLMKTEGNTKVTLNYVPKKGVQNLIKKFTKYPTDDKIRNELFLACGYTPDEIKQLGGSKHASIDVEKAKQNLFNYSPQGIICLKFNVNGKSIMIPETVFTIISTFDNPKPYYRGVLDNIDSYTFVYRFFQASKYRYNDNYYTYLSWDNHINTISILTYFTCLINLNKRAHEIAKYLSNLSESNRQTLVKITSDFLKNASDYYYEEINYNNLYNKMMSSTSLNGKTDQKELFEKLDKELKPENNTKDIDNNASTTKIKETIDKTNEEFKENVEKKTGTIFDPNDETFKRVYAAANSDNYPFKYTEGATTPQYSTEWNDDDYQYMDLGKVPVHKDYVLRHISNPYATFGIAGTPANYLKTTDPPAFSQNGVDSLGYTYMNHNIRYGQYIVFRPCVANYRVGATDIDKVFQGTSDIKNLAGYFSKLAAAELVELEPRMYNYWQQVTRSCIIVTRLMGIQNELFTFDVGKINTTKSAAKGAKDHGVDFSTFNTVKLGEVQADVWSMIGIAYANAVANKQQIDFGSIVGPDGSVTNEDTGIVAFMVDGTIETNDSLSNQYTNSPLVEAISGISDTKTAIKDIMNQIFTPSTGQAGGWLDYFKGIQMVPKVWNGSSYDKSYSVRFKFTSDSGDPVSVFLNCIFPLIKLLHLALPESVGGYLLQPWILNVFSSSAVNIDMGMINMLSIDKNMTTLNDYGMPTELTVTIQIMDLRAYLYQDKPKMFNFSSKHNGSMTRLMATLVGQNVTTISRSKIRTFNEEIAQLTTQMTFDSMNRNFSSSILRVIGRMGTWFGRQVLYAKDAVRTVKDINYIGKKTIGGTVKGPNYPVNGNK